MQEEGFRISAASPPTPDDERWTAEHPSSNGATPGTRKERLHPLVVLGYITAVAMPPIGLIVGIVVSVRPIRASSKHGLGIIVLSIVAAPVWVLILTSGALTSPSNGY